VKNFLHVYREFEKSTSQIQITVVTASAVLVGDGILVVYTGITA
jgi:hypothetical protein